MSYSVRGTSITLTRGDTFDAQIYIKVSDTDYLYTPKPTDKIFFGVKKRTEDEYCVVYKEIPYDTLRLHLDSEDTRWLDVGNYWYDIQLTTIDGYVSTFITKSLFKITEEVCYND